MKAQLSKKIISYTAPFISSLGLHKLFAPLYAGVGHVLMFHRIVEPQNKVRIHNHESLEISPQQLRDTVQFFRKRGYTFYSLDQLQNALIQGEFNKKFVVFTFDDGYLDNYELAYPILKELEVPFCIYITTNFPNRKAILWWYMLEDMIREFDRLQFSFYGSEYSIPCRNIDEKEAAFSQVRKLITQNFEADQYAAQLELVFKSFESDMYAYVQKMAMSWEHIRELSKSEWVTIGAHTVNHFPLKQLRAHELGPEILNSQKILEEELQTSVDHFAYPFGKAAEADQREFEFIKSQGFKTAVTTRMSNIFPGHVNHMEALPRININRVSTDSVLKLQTGGMLPFVVHKGKKLVTK
ncbi:MAG: polysaccharide deacetylase family protein [Bacteroidota bacterium]